MRRIVVVTCVAPTCLLLGLLLIVCLILADRLSADPVCITSQSFRDDIRVYRSLTSNPSWTVVMSDGTTVVVQIRRWGIVFMLDVTVSVTPVRKGGLAGLCGKYDGQKSNDLRGAFGNSTEGEFSIFGHAVPLLWYNSCVGWLLSCQRRAVSVLCRLLILITKSKCGRADLGCARI